MNIKQKLITMSFAVLALTDCRTPAERDSTVKANVSFHCKCRCVGANGFTALTNDNSQGEHGGEGGNLLCSTPGSIADFNQYGSGFICVDITFDLTGLSSDQCSAANSQACKGWGVRANERSQETGTLTSCSLMAQ